MDSSRFERAPFDLNQLSVQLIAQLRPGLKRHVLELGTGAEPLPIEGDEVRLQQVLQNLIQNAIKYSPQGGLVRVQVSHDAFEATVSVTDEGIGIPPASIPRLFGRYYRAPNAEAWRIGGMGIGLYVVEGNRTLTWR